MNAILKFKHAILLVIFFNISVCSQTKQELIIKRDFTPLLDSLIKPPSNTSEAWSLVMFDSVNNKFEFTSVLKEQDQMLQNMIGDINIFLTKTKSSGSQKHPPQSMNGPPQGMTPGGMQMPDEFKEIKEDLDDADIAADKMEVLKEKFKNDITSMQDLTNEKLHKTLETDYDAHVNIINDFMETVFKSYLKYNTSFMEYTRNLDDIIKKYDYGDKVKFNPLRSEILKLQLVQLNNLYFMLNITKEFTIIGARFYREKQENIN